MIKKFESFNQEPDLRKIGKGVYCKKNYMNKNIKFTKGLYYYVKGFYGDPQGAIEKYNINNYLPVECISAIVLKDDNNNNYNFKINPKNSEHFKYDDFFEYFEISDLIDNIIDYNI